jgi:hypothetical protein
LDLRQGAQWDPALEHSAQMAPGWSVRAAS